MTRRELFTSSDCMSVVLAATSETTDWVQCSRPMWCSSFLLYFPCFHLVPQKKPFSYHRIRRPQVKCTSPHMTLACLYSHEKVYICLLFSSIRWPPFVAVSRDGVTWSTTVGFMRLGNWKALFPSPQKDSSKASNVFTVIACLHLVAWATIERLLLVGTTYSFNQASESFDETIVGRTRCLVARTSRCGWAIS